MTSTTVTTLAAVGEPAIRPLRFATVLAVELRKLTDTRSGRGLLAATLVAATAVLVRKVTRRRRRDVVRQLQRAARPR